jgi:hypothetical protein
MPCLSGEKEDAFRRRGLAGVNVGNDADVAYFFQGVLGGMEGGGRRASWGKGTAGSMYASPGRREEEGIGMLQQDGLRPSSWS